MNKSLLTLGLLISSAILFLNSCKSKENAADKKPIQVQYVTLKKDSVPMYVEYVGQTYGKSDIKINTRVEGNVLSVLFKEGDQVKEGQLLYIIDPVSYQAKVEEARGSVEEARSELVNATEDLKRIRPLADMNAASKRELDEAVAKEKMARAKLRSQEAYLETQQIILGYCNITAPVSGTIGISNVKEGDFVSPLGQKSVLNTVSDVTLIRVRFPITENEYLSYVQDKTEREIPIKISMQLSNGTLYPHAGQISFKDRSVDPLTGSMTLESVFPNPEGLLVPGQYVRLRIQRGLLPDAIVIPERAVREIQGTYQVFIIDNKNALQVRVIKPGPKTDSGWVILEGLKGDEKVILLGSNFLT